MITLTFDTEMAVRAALPHIKTHLQRAGLESNITDEQLVAKLTATLVPVVIHPTPSSNPRRAT